jgi:uncharacterized protein YndB with AHSA1/START domain
MGSTIFSVDKDNLEVRAERIYLTTPERLYDAHTDPEQIAQWWGPAKYKVIVDVMDVRVDGVWRFTHESAAGERFAFNGVYKVLDRPNKIVDTFEFEGTPGHILVETTTFSAQPDGSTKLVLVSRYENVADLEAMISSGMKAGLVEGQDRLARLVES